MNMQGIPEWVNNYMGLPFVDGGRHHSGIDCYGLIYLIYLEQFGIVLPEYGNLYKDLSDRVAVSEGILVEAQQVRWKIIPEYTAKLGDVAVFRVGKHPLHVGMMLNKTVMVNTVKGHEVTIEEYNGILWKNRFINMYRHQDLCPS